MCEKKMQGFELLLIKICSLCSAAMIASRNRHRVVWDDRRASFQVIPLPCENGTDPDVDYGMSNHPHHCGEYQPCQHKANYDAKEMEPHDFSPASVSLFSVFFSFW